MMLTCHLTVASLMPRASPISRLLWPLTISSSTSISRALSSECGGRSARLLETEAGMDFKPESTLRVAVDRSFWGMAFKFYPRGPGSGRFLIFFVPFVGVGEEESRLRLRFGDGAYRFHSAQPGQAQIHQRHIGRLPGADRASFLSGTRLRNHGHIRLQADDRRQPEAHHRVIVYEDDANCR